MTEGRQSNRLKRNLKYSIAKLRVLTMLHLIEILPILLYLEKALAIYPSQPSIQSVITDRQDSFWNVLRRRWCEWRVKLGAGELLIITWAQKFIVTWVQIHINALGQVWARCSALFRHVIPFDCISPEIFDQDMRSLGSLFLHWVLHTILKQTFLHAYLIDIIVAIRHDILLVKVATICTDLLATEESLAFLFRIVANAHNTFEFSFMRVNRLLPIQLIRDARGAEWLRTVT